MCSLNLSYLNLSTIKKSISLLFCLSLFACSSTEQVNYATSNNNFFDDGYSRGFVNDNFSHTQFTPINKNMIKKAMNSDHQLMMSLLNRPVTADQAMMLAFEQERANYSYPFSNYAVEIKGDKSSDKSNNRANNAYAKLISQDINAVNIIASN